jgi:hypothetical protein
MCLQYGLFGVYSLKVSKSLAKICSSLIITASLQLSFNGSTKWDDHDRSGYNG